MKRENSGGNRNTIQRDLVMAAVKKLPHPTAEEVYDCISEEHPNISKATVYRNLNVLAELGRVLKVPTTGSADRFDMTAEIHYHAQCRNCGKIFDLEVDTNYIQLLRKQIRDSYGFQVDGQDLIFKGLCPKCQS